MVLQKNVLFSGTIIDNMHWGDEKASLEEIQHVCKLAQADSFIQNFPAKYEHYIEQGGSNVSGGQRQRVLIARALACQPEILFLDEPTANIDPGAEEQFYATLEELRKRMTVLTVSHDLGFVNSQVDSIICVNKVVSLHHAASFTAETANAIYHHEVNLIQHEHSCFCCCENERRSK
jgi:ABC-type bacteriocin/lantibiotic exporter with double-glycine peptidase domain